MLAKEIMTTKVITVTPDMLVKDVVRLLTENGISAAPVLNVQGIAIGMISANRFQDKAETTEEQKAYQIMTSPVITTEETTPVSEIAHLLIQHNITRIPILKDNKIVGIVSRADIIKAFAILSDKASKGYMPEHGK